MNTRWRWLLLLALLVAPLAGALARPAAHGLASQTQQAILPAQVRPPGSPAARLMPAARTQGVASVVTTTISIPTYPYDACLEWQIGGPPPGNYPYRRLDWACYGSPKPAPKSYRLLVLENDYLRVTLLPELGGRVYQMIYKPSGHNELYQNPVIKPTHWGPPEQPWWLAVGGIEWCLPVDEHGYYWGDPWAYQIASSAAGVTVTLRDTTATNRLRSVVAVHLPAERAYVAITHRLENPTASTLNGKYWSNALLAPGSANSVSAETRFVFRTDEVSVHSSGDDRLPGHYPTVPAGPDYRFSWPVYQGVDYSRLGNWDEWLGFFAYPQAAGGFVGVFDTAADEGIVRVFPPEVARGAKGFGMGWANPIAPDTWTDDGSTYVELHGGLAATFWDWATLGPGQAAEWTEVWYPVYHIGQLDAATDEAALGAAVSAGTLTVGVHSTVARPAGESTLYVWQRATCTELASWRLPAIDPATPFTAATPTGGLALEELAVVYVDQAGQVLAALNFHDCLEPRAWVEPLPPFATTSTFAVTWAGSDLWSSIDVFDVQVRDGVEGAWTAWQTATPELGALFSGVHGHTYFFRARARDSAGSWGAFTADEWGQAFTTVLTQPAPVLVTSRKLATPRLFAAGRTVSYTLLISNTGSASGAVSLTDTPPDGMIVLTSTLSASLGPLPSVTGGAIEWAGSLPAGQSLRVGYALAPTGSVPWWVPLTNTLTITGSVLGPFTRQTAVMQGHGLWLPIAMRQSP